MPLFSNGGAASLAGSPVYPSSVKATWQTAYSDATTTTSAGDVSNPRSNTAGLITWYKVPENAARVIIRAKTKGAIANVTTSPSVKVLGAYVTQDLGPGGSNLTSSASSSWPTGAVFARLDNNDLGATASALTFSTTANNNPYDGTYYYSQMLSLTPTDCLGSWYIGVAVTTAIAFSSGGDTTTVELAFLN